MSKKGGAVLMGMADNEPEDSTSMVHGKMDKTRKMCLKKCKKNHKCNSKCVNNKSKKRGGNPLTDAFNNATGTVTSFFSKKSDVGAPTSYGEDVINPLQKYNIETTPYSEPNITNNVVNTLDKFTDTDTDKKPFGAVAPAVGTATEKIGGKTRRKRRKTKKNKSRRRKY